MCRGKTFLLTAIVLIMASVANAGLVLTVNGLDTSMPIEVKADDIIIAVAGQTDEQKESYSVTCEMGGKLEPLPEPNTLAEKPKEGDYLFTFEDEELGLAIVNLTVGDLLDYQLILFKIPDANTIIFGIDSDAVQNEPEPEPSKVSEVNEPNEPNEPDMPRSSLFEPTRGEPNELLIHTFPVQSANDPPTSPVNCPSDNVKPYHLEGFTLSPIDEGRQSAMGEGSYVELQEITDSLFLDPNVVYYVPNPPLLIHGIGEEIDVVIPSDTTIILAEDWDYGIVVYDSANVHFGEPAPQPNEPNLIYEPNDVNNPVLPVWIVGESGSPFFNNFCGIFIDRTAGTRCKLDNIYLSGFYYGIQVDQQLDYPLSNIHALGCYNGILSFGANPHFSQHQLKKAPFLV